MRGTTAFKVLQDLVAPLLRSGRYSQSFCTLNVVEPHATYPNLYVESVALSDIMNKSQEMTVFSGRQRLTSAMKLRPEK